MNFESNYKKLEEFAAVLFIIFSGFITVAVFKLINFRTFLSLDEMLWYTRSRIFWDKMLESAFSGLIQSAQPGITVYWFTGFTMKLVNFDFQVIPNFFYLSNVKDQSLYKSFEAISFVFNVPLLLLTVAFFIAFYYLIRKLGFNKIIASFSLLFLVTNIFLVYYNTPSDKMLNIFITLSFLTFLVYLGKKSKKYLILSAVFGSWAVLAKLSALFIFLIYPFIFILYTQPLSKSKIKSVAKDYFLWVLVFIFVSIIFLPTIVTQPEEIYRLVFDSGRVTEEKYNGNGYFFKLLFDYVKAFIFYVSYYMSQISVLSIIAYFFLRFKKKYRKYIFFNSLTQKHIKAISIYILLFVIMVTLTSHNHDIRFLSPVLVMINIFSAIGLYGISKMVIEKLKTKSRESFYATIAFITIFSQIVVFCLNRTLLM